MYFRDGTQLVLNVFHLNALLAMVKLQGKVPGAKGTLMLLSAGACLFSILGILESIGKPEGASELL